MSYRDKYGFLHDRINPKHNDTTNFPLYDSTLIVLTEPDYVRDVKYLDRVAYLYREGRWHSSMETNDDEFSLDNNLGVVCGLVTLINKYKELFDEEMNRDDWEPHESIRYAKIVTKAQKLLDKVPWFHKQNDHPEGLILTWYAKTKLAWPLLWFPFLSMMYGALTPHEKNKAAGHGMQPKTSTHILTLLWCVALDLKFTRKCYEKIVLDKWIKPPQPEIYREVILKEQLDVLSNVEWKWTKWENIFLEYYKDENHPNVIASRNL